MYTAINKSDLMQTIKAKFAQERICKDLIIYTLHELECLLQGGSGDLSHRQSRGGAAIDSSGVSSEKTHVKMVLEPAYKRYHRRQYLSATNS